MKKIFLVFGLVLIFGACEKDNDVTTDSTTTTTTTTTQSSYQCDSKYTTRTGAICNDGTTSSATGSGACSSHGGVDYWLCQ